MTMKEHILAALREQFERWEQLLANLTDDQILDARFDLAWSIKDVVAHLWAWQQISIARMEGGMQNREPELPKWIVDSIENWEQDANSVNALTYEAQHDKPWSDIHEIWRNGFLRFLEVGEKIPERDLLDGDRYGWLNGYNLAAILIASYDHHQEHLEKLNAALRAQ
jgi:hypothetical protein